MNRSMLSVMALLASSGCKTSTTICTMSSYRDPITVPPDRSQSTGRFFAFMVRCAKALVLSRFMIQHLAQQPEPLQPTRLRNVWLLAKEALVWYSPIGKSDSIGLWLQYDCYSLFEYSTVISSVPCLFAFQLIVFRSDWRALLNRLLLCFVLSFPSAWHRSF